LAFGQWLISDDNPLTVRVIVNRVWQHHFGTGLVATPSDFGQMGARPTHPELLDWLADWFTHDAEWSLKKLHRLIVTSDVYRQSSALRAPSSIDPENRLLWHFPYRRLDVEAIRDSMLAVSGNLNGQMYGPAVFLPIPAAAIEAHTDKQGAWQASQEPDIDRRTVYAYVKRVLVPMMETVCDDQRQARSITSVARRYSALQQRLRPPGRARAAPPQARTTGNANDSPSPGILPPASPNPSHATIPRPKPPPRGQRRSCSFAA
jgi:hypothetical protein